MLAINMVHNRSWYGHIRIVLVLLLPDALLRYDLDQHALEVDGKSSFQLFGAHPQKLHALVEVDVGVVVLV